MKNQTLKTISSAALVILMLAVFAQVRVPAQVKKSNEQGLVGSWDVQVTIRDCQTGAPFFSFPAMSTYNQGGTMRESDLGGPGQVGIGGDGVWRHQTDHQYSAAFRSLLFNLDRTFVGTNVVRSAISLGQSGNEYTSTDRGELIDANGNVLAVFCGTQIATRFK